MNTYKWKEHEKKTKMKRQPLFALNAPLDRLQFHESLRMRRRDTRWSIQIDDITSH